MIAATIIGLAPTLLILLGIGALISAAETSMTAASRGRLHQLERDGDRSARRVNRLIGDQEKMIGAILLSNNVVNIGASALTTAVLGALIPGAWGIVLATAVMTVLIVIFGEILPKTLAIGSPDRVARAVAPVISVMVTLLSPIVYGVQLFVGLILRPVGWHGTGDAVLSATLVYQCVDTLESMNEELCDDRTS